MRKPNIVLTAWQREQVARLYADGGPIKVIAHRFGIHKTTVCFIAKAAGLPRRHVYGKRNHVIENKAFGEFGVPAPYQPGL